MAGVMQLTLERDGHDQPWGFRLQGGSDVGLPLSVQRILVGTPADGILKRDDIILRIGHRDTKNISHKQAAELFTRTGNQISMTIKRTGRPAYTEAAVTGLSLSANDGANSLMNALPKTGYKDATSKHDPSLPLSIKNQPYRTNPLIQPSIKVTNEPGTSLHLKRQAGHIAAAQGPLSVGYSTSGPPPQLEIPTPAPIRADTFAMQQKGQAFATPTGLRKSTTSKMYSPMSGWQTNQVTGTLQTLQQQTQPSFSSRKPPQSASSLPQPDKLTFKPVEKTVTFAVPEKMHHHQPVVNQAPNSPAGPGKQVYNSPINLYSVENVSEVAKLNQMGMAPVSTLPTAKPLNPMNKPAKVKSVAKGALPVKYDPEQSATWQAIRELEECQLVTEHGPSSGKLYSI